MDKASYERLYGEMLPGLYRLAQSILRQPADAQDAVQQAALKAWQRAESIREDSAKAYFARAVINECRSIQRQRMRVTAFAEIPNVQSQDGNGELRRVIDAMPEQLRLPLLLKYMEGYTEKEAAAALHITVPALKARLYRARRWLEKELREEVELL